ncbi:PH domain-containing protein [Lysinibacillus sp. KU-BSD001]|uniref:PH domain-containing protein n=1 Tax=Lysinibacillus sp. KU-BSD001 TaxID=3141328 RepID=UPI0036F1456B
MREQPKYKIPERGVTVWRIYGLFQTLLLAILAGVATFLTYTFEWPLYIYLIAWGIVILAIILFIWIFPNVRYNIWRYEVREQEIEIQSGLFVVTRTLIPMVRVQHVDTEQGPILKRYRLSNISISSAATTHTIPFLETHEADALRARISELARVAEEDV